MAENQNNPQSNPPQFAQSGPAHPSNKITLENLDQVFGYQRPNDNTTPRYEAINRASKELARVILEEAPDCAFRSTALSHVVDARMRANAAIATSPEALLPARPTDDE